MDNGHTTHDRQLPTMTQHKVESMAWYWNIKGRAYYNNKILELRVLWKLRVYRMLSQVAAMSDQAQTPQSAAGAVTT